MYKLHLVLVLRSVLRYISLISASDLFPFPISIKSSYTKLIQGEGVGVGALASEILNIEEIQIEIFQNPHSPIK